MNEIAGRKKSSAKAQKREPYVFLPNINEVIGGRLRLRYSVVDDTYFRDYDDTLNPKSKNTKTDWQSVLYSCEGIRKFRDEIHDELYFDREDNFKTAHLSWKFDFTASGLVLDAIQMKAEVVQTESGQVEVTVTNEEDKIMETKLHEEVNSLKTLDFGGSKVLTVKVSISADEPGQFTKLFLQSIAGKKLDCPLDINIRLKRPTFALGRSLLLLGLMFSKEKLGDSQKRSRQKRIQKENSKGYLYVHIHQAKRLPLRVAGIAPDPQVKCKLVMEGKEVTCKSTRVRKTINPIWDDQYVYGGIAEESLSLTKLQLQVTHDVRAFNRCKKREVLGSANIQLLSWLDSGSEEEGNDNLDIQTAKRKSLQQNTCEITCSRITESEKSVHRLTSDNDLIDIMLNGSSPEISSKPFNDETYDNTLNRHRSVSLTSLQSTAKGSIVDIDTTEEKTWWGQARRKSLGKIFTLGLSKSEKETLNLKRPSIVLSNSQESVVVLEPSATMKDDSCNTEDDVEHDSSQAELRKCEALRDSRRATLTPLIDSTIEAFVAPITQVQDITTLAGSHWEQLINHKNRWLYCWHPLSYVEI